MANYTIYIDEKGTAKGDKWERIESIPFSIEADAYARFKEIAVASCNNAASVDVRLFATSKHPHSLLANFHMKATKF